MIDNTEIRNPLDVLAEEFTDRCRRGERPTVDEYADTHVELADEIRELFPTIVAMERLKQRKLTSGSRPVAARIEKLEQLGDYRIVREIGRGGMGIVFEAEQQSLARRVAVKVFPQHALGDSRNLRRFQREARTVARLHHTNIVQVYGVGQQDGLHYYVMQYIRGVGLDKVIDQLKATSPADDDAAEKSGAPLAPSARTRTATDAARAILNDIETRTDALAPAVDSGSDSQHLAAAATRKVDSSDASQPAMAAGAAARAAPPRPVARSDGDFWQGVARIGIQVGEALQYAHAQGVFHRDVKPANLLLDAQGTVWVADFGLAKAIEQDDLSQTGDIVGTLRYMAPEQLTGNYDARSDVYSLGMTLYELLALRPVYDESDRTHLLRRVAQGEPAPPRKFRPDIPRDLETIVLKAIARNPNHRYPTAAELAADMRRFLDNRPIRARRVSPVERLWRWSRRNPAVASLSAMLLLVVLAAFAAISWKWQDAEREKQRAQLENSRAEANLSLALDSMDQFLDRFASTWMAHPSEPQSEDGENEVEFRMVVSDSTAVILQDALKFYDQFAEQNADNPRLRRDTAKAHRRVGDIHERLGQYDKAESAYRRALELLEAQAESFPNNADLAADTAATLNQLALVLKTVDRYDEANSHLDRARRILAAQLERSPESLRCQYELALTYDNLGGVLWRRRQPNEAAASQRRAMELLETLVERHPENADYRLALARTYRSNAPFMSFGKPRDEATDYRAEAIVMLEKLVADFPNVPDYRCELSETLARTNVRFRAPENPETVQQATVNLQRAVELARPLKEQYPSIPRYRSALARALQELGSVLRRGGNPDEAERCFAEAVLLYRSLAGEFSFIDAYQFFLASALFEHGETLRDLRRLDESRSEIERAIAQHQSYTKSQPESAFGRSMLWREYESLAATLREMGETAAAENAALKAEKLRRAWDSKFKRRRGSPPVEIKE